WEQRVALDRRPLRSRARLGILAMIDERDRVRVAHRHRREYAAVTSGWPPVAEQLWRPHVDRDMPEGAGPRVKLAHVAAPGPSVGVDHELPSGVRDDQRDAAEAISAHLGAGAVVVDDDHGRRGPRSAGWG